MKEYHPDKFQDDDDNKALAEEKSKQIIQQKASLENMVYKHVEACLNLINKNKI